MIRKLLITLTVVIGTIGVGWGLMQTTEAASITSELVKARTGEPIISGVTNVPNVVDGKITLVPHATDFAANGATLQEALYYAASQTTKPEIILPAGTYKGNFIMKEGVNVTGADKATTILDATGTKGRVVSYATGVVYDGTEASISNAFTTATKWSNLTIQGGKTTDGGAGAFICANVTLENCIITGNATVLKDTKAGDKLTPKGGGVMCYFGGTVNNCDIHGNTSVDGGGGVVLNGGGTVSNSLIHANKAPGDHSGGINTRDISNNASMLITNCVIYANEAVKIAGVSLNGNIKMVNSLVHSNKAITTTATDAAAVIVGSTAAEMLNCTVWGNTAGNANVPDVVVGNYSTTGKITNCIMQSHSGTGTITYSATGSAVMAGTGNLVNLTDPKFVDGGYALQPTSPCIDKGANGSITDAEKDITGINLRKVRTVDMGAYENQQAITDKTIVYVAVGGTGDGATAGSALPANALQLAINTVQSGTEIKLAAGTYTGNFIMKDGVNVTGAGQGKTILDGEAKGRVVSSGIAYTKNEANSGFANSTTWSNLTIQNGSVDGVGAGALITKNITLKDCSITGNKATGNNGKGGGVMCDHGGIIDNCLIYSNTAEDGGGGIAFNHNGAITNSSVYNNTAEGTTQDDHSGGINVRGGEDVRIENCKVYGNKAARISGVNMSGKATMVNTLVYGNTATQEGLTSLCAVYITSTSTMLNCTVWGNIAAKAGEEANVLIISNAVVTNSIMQSHSGTGTITYSASGSELTGNGNISNANPKFTDAAKDDYTLLPASACINKGTNTGVTAKTDLAGNTRIQGGTVDMGAYESNAAIIPNNEGIVYVTEKGAGLNNGNSPTNAISPALLASAIANTNVTTLQFAKGTYALSDTIVVARATKLTFAAAKGADGKYAIATLKPATDYAGRAIRVAQGANLQIDGLTISDFKTVASGSGIYNDGTLVLNKVTMSGNVSDKGKDKSVYGAAIFNRANLIVNGGTFSANKTPNWMSGALFNRGGSTATFTGVMFTENEAIHSSVATGYGTVTFDNCEFDANVNTSVQYGLIYNDSAQPGVRSLTIKGCRFFDNTAEYMVYSEGVSTEITHCVFDGNKRTGTTPAGNSGLIKVGRSVASGTDFPVTNTPAVLTSNTFISAGATTGTHNPAVLNDNGNITLTKNIFVNAEATWVALANTTIGTGITRTWRGAMNVFGKVDDPIKTSISIEANKNVFDKTITDVAFEDQTSKKYNLGSGSVAIIATDYAGAFAPLAGDVVVATGTIYLSTEGAGTKDGSSEANAAPLTKFKTAADKTAVTKIILMENITLTSELAIARTSGSLTIEAAKPEITVTAAAGQSAFTISNGSMVTMKGFTIAGAIKSNGQLTLTNCTFDGNCASEVITLGGASSSIERCIFKGASNNGSGTNIIGITATGAGARITNSLFYGFGARSLATLGADATLTNNTFVTADNVNAIVVTAGTATVVNNILIKGTGDKATISGKATVMNNAMIDDYAGGTNNVKVANLAAVGFVNTTTLDYRLLSTSPCVDKGAGVNASLDLAGNTRVQGGIPDMGAYEVAQITDTQTWNTKEYQNQSVIVRKGGKLTLTKNDTEFTAIADITVEDGGQVFTGTTDAVTTTGLSHIHTFAAPGVWEAVSLPFGEGTSTYPITSKNGWLAGTDKNQTKGTWAATAQSTSATAPGTPAYFAANTTPYAGTGHILAAASTATTGTVTDTLSFTKTDKAAFAMTETAAKIAEDAGTNFCFFVNPTLHEITLTGYAYILEAKGKTFERVFAPTIKPFGCYIVTKASFTLKSFALRTDVVTGNESIEATEGYHVYTTQGHVVVDTAEELQVAIVNMQGAMVYQARVGSGQTMISLPAGIYIVNGTKVIVR